MSSPIERFQADPHVQKANQLIAMLQDCGVEAQPLLTKDGLREAAKSVISSVDGLVRELRNALSKMEQEVRWPTPHSKNW